MNDRRMTLINHKDHLPTEYTVYTIDKSDRLNDHHPMWRRKHRTVSKRKAIARAKILHRSMHYDRVEVKKRTCNSKHGCRVQDDYRVYDLNQSQRRFRQMMISTVCVCLTVLGFYALALL